MISRSPNRPGGWTAVMVAILPCFRWQAMDALMKRWNVLASQLDADRFDYLLRDNLHTGSR